MLVRIGNRDDPDWKQTDVCLTCISSHFWQTTSVQNFSRTFTMIIENERNMSVICPDLIPSHTKSSQTSKGTDYFNSPCIYQYISL